MSRPACAPAPSKRPERWADATLMPHADPAALLSQVDEVWTMTSLTGFEALLRGMPVT